MKTTTRRNKPSISLEVKNYSGDTVSVKLSNGRQVDIRKMLGKDFLFIEKNLADTGETEKSFKLLERLSLAPNSITFTEILDMTTEDIATLSEALAKANGVEPEGEEEEEEI